MNAIMKTLDVKSIENGLIEIKGDLKQQKDQISNIQSAIQDFISTEASFKGKGGQSIRAFYNDAHHSFLEFYNQVIETYESTLDVLKNEMESYEPSSNGLIRESFLGQDLETGLTYAKDTVIDITNDANQTIHSVNDIISIPPLDDNRFHQQLRSAKQHKDETVEKLFQFDQNQWTSLDKVDQDIQLMNKYINQIHELFESGQLSVDTYQSNNDYNQISEKPIISTDAFSSITKHPRVISNGVGISDFNNEMNWDPSPTLGLNFESWRENSINAATNLGVATATGYTTAKSINKNFKGFGVKREFYLTAQGATKTRIHVTNPELMGFNKKTYSGTNATNYPKLYKLVDPMTNIKASFKWAGNRIGVVGVAATVTGDIIHGIQQEKTASEIAGNVAGDVVIAGSSIVASAYAGALAGGVIGGPVGLAVGALAGALAGIFITTALSDLKFMDVDNDGELDSIGDAIKKGTTALLDDIGEGINSIVPWFD